MSPQEATILGLVRSGYFRVDPDGAIWRLQKRMRTGRCVDIAPVRADRVKPDGYSIVSVQIAGVEFRALAHRIVWLALKGDIPDDLEVNHQDGRRSHNAITNLELCTKGENLAHAYRCLNRVRAGGERNGRAKLTAADVTVIRSLRGQKSSRVVGAEFEISHRMVLDIWNGKRWAAAA